MKDTIKILRKAPGCPAEWIELPNRLEDLQREVGGYIEILPITDGSCLICNEEGKLQGLPEDSFRAIADYWTVYLRQTGNLPDHRELSSEDAAIMMILLKVARQAGRGKLDNWIDIAGYAACGAEIAEG